MATSPAFPTKGPTNEHIVAGKIRLQPKQAGGSPTPDPTQPAGPAPNPTGWTPSPTPAGGPITGPWARQAPGAPQAPVGTPTPPVSTGPMPPPTSGGGIHNEHIMTGRIRLQPSKAAPAPTPWPPHTIGSPILGGGGITGTPVMGGPGDPRSIIGTPQRFKPGPGIPERFEPGPGQQRFGAGQQASAMGVPQGF